MKLEFATTQLSAQPILGIRATTAMDKLAQLMGPLFGEVHGYIQQHGQAPAAMPLARYHSMDGRHRGSRVRDTGCIPDGRHGPHPGLRASGRNHGDRHSHGAVRQPSGYLGGALTEWMKSEGLEAAGAPWEVYVTDPGAEPDQSKWRTDIFFPVR
jgi:AraC family transcriptional regulator